MNIPKDLIDFPEKFVFKLRGCGICACLRDNSSRYINYVICPKDYILDGSVNRNNEYNRRQEILQVSDFKSYDLESLKLKNPEEYFENKVHDFDIIAYKDCRTNVSAIVQCLDNHNIVWDWEE